jgi:hypothetical protein
MLLSIVIVWRAVSALPAGMSPIVVIDVLV